MRTVFGKKKRLEGLSAGCLHVYKALALAHNPLSLLTTALLSFPSSDSGEILHHAVPSLAHVVQETVIC